jgi:Cytochrome C biogenesis protein transmembrane region
MLTLAVAFLAGIVSFASPCCLPVVPAYVSYIVGTTPADSPNARRVAFRQSLAFVLGFTIDRAVDRRGDPTVDHLNGVKLQSFFVIRAPVGPGSTLTLAVRGIPQERSRRPTTGRPRQ